MKNSKKVQVKYPNKGITYAGDKLEEHSGEYIISPEEEDILLLLRHCKNDMNKFIQSITGKSSLPSNSPQLQLYKNFKAFAEKSFMQKYKIVALECRQKGKDNVLSKDLILKLVENSFADKELILELVCKLHLIYYTQK